MIMKGIFFIILFFLALNCFGQESDNFYRYNVEIFPQMMFFRIYSAQFVYNISEKDSFIIGFTYLNNYYPNKKEAIGQFFAPTIPIGYRRYLWKNINIEFQLWPAYNFFKDLTTDKFYNGFDLAASVRLGYRFDFNIKQLPFYINAQIEYLFGIYGGNKPDNFSDAAGDVFPIFPAISFGYKW